MIFVDTGAWFAVAVLADPDHLFSFVDCTSFVIMERLGINHAFAFDHHFDEYPGIIKVPR